MPQQFVPMDSRPAQEQRSPQFYGSEAGDQRRPDQQPTSGIPQIQQQQQYKRHNGDPYAGDEQQQGGYEGGRTERNIQETGNAPIDRKDAKPQDAAPWHRDAVEKRTLQPVEEERIYSQETNPVVATEQKKEHSPVRMRQSSYIANDFSTHPEGENKNLTRTKSKTRYYQ